MTLYNASYDSSLDQFLLLAKNARGRACAALIQQALTNPNIYLFRKLLDARNISALKGSEFDSSYKLLWIFAFGTYNDYIGEKDRLPTLTPAQELKLQKLTVVSLAQDTKAISYDLLMEALHINTVRALEDVLIETIYAGLIQGKIDQKSRRMRVTQVIARDVQDSDIDGLKNKLNNWQLEASKICNKIDEILRSTTQSMHLNVMHEGEIRSKICLSLEKGRSTRDYSGSDSRIGIDERQSESIGSSRKSANMGQRTPSALNRKRM